LEPIIKKIIALAGMLFSAATLHAAKVTVFAAASRRRHAC
jgi:hypothetical protein